MRSRKRNLTAFLGLAAALWLVFTVLNFGTVWRNPTFVILGEAWGNSAPWLIKTRLRVAGWFGGRADTLIGYGDQSALEIASERQNMVFLVEAVRYSSHEHVRKVFDLACIENRLEVIRILQEKDSKLECPQAQPLENAGQDNL